MLEYYPKFEKTSLFMCMSFHVFVFEVSYFWKYIIRLESWLLVQYEIVCFMLKNAKDFSAQFDFVIQVLLGNKTPEVDQN